MPTLSPGWKVLPRWRTMIVPLRTYCPSPRLTPSRLPALSRPFLLDEPAFLCAIGYSLDSAFLAVLRRRAAGFAGASSVASALSAAFVAAGLRVRFGFSAVSASADASAFSAFAAFLPDAL